MHAKLLQSSLILCNPMEHTLPGYSVRGILQARILEWVAMPSSRGSSQPRDQTHISCVCCIGRQVLYHQRHLESPGAELRFPPKEVPSVYKSFSECLGKHGFNVKTAKSKEGTGGNSDMDSLREIWKDLLYATWSSPGGTNGKEPICQHRQM